MYPYQIIEAGTYTNAASPAVTNIQLTCQPDLFIVTNRTNWGDDTAITGIESYWKRGFAQGAYKSLDQAVTTGILSTNTGTSNGFTFIDPANPPTYTALASSATTAANPAVVSMANTGSIGIGDVVRVLNNTNMQQISGMDFTVTAVTANTSITLGYLDASGFAAPGTTGSILKFIPSRYYPRWRYITKITQASQAVITFSVAHDYTPGEIISLRVPSQFGMTQANNKQVRVLSTTTSTVTVELDTSGFTAFAFPTSAIAALGISNAVAVPSSSGVVPANGSATIPQQPPGTNLLDAFDNRNQYFMQLGTSVVGAASAVMDWVAYKVDLYNGA